MLNWLFKISNRVFNVIRKIMWSMFLVSIGIGCFIRKVDKFGFSEAYIQSERTLQKELLKNDYNA
jgi:hypothetical protein